MNKTYKIIWSQIKSTYVVVSEIAKSHSKNNSEKAVKAALSAAVGSALLFGGFAGISAAPATNPAGTGPGIAIGKESSASHQSATAIGTNVTAKAVGAVAIGDENTANAAYAVAVGTKNFAAQTSTALGYNNEAKGLGSFAIGNTNKAEGQHAYTFGLQNRVVGHYSFGIGEGNQISGIGSYALGRRNMVGGNNAYVLGEGNIGTGAYSIALGALNKAGGKHALAAGYNSTVGSTSENALAIGQGAQVGATGATATVDPATGAVTAKYSGEKNATEGIAVGHATGVMAEAGVAIGRRAFVSGKEGVAFGPSAVASVEGATAIGARSVASGEKSVALGYGARASKTGSIALGNGAQTAHDDISVGGTIAMGMNAFAHVGRGRQEAYFGFDKSNWNIFFGRVLGVKDPTRVATGIALGVNAFARTGSIQIGSHTYEGKMGGIEVKNHTDTLNGTNREGHHVNQVTVGTNSYNKGVFGTIIGAYSISTGDFTGRDDTTQYAGQNFGANIVGSLNSIRSTGHEKYAGVANSIVGIANMTENTNGSLIFGAGNQITNSIGEIFGVGRIEDIAKNVNSADDMVDELRKETIARESGGATMAFGGGNTADYTRASQIMGVNNTLKGKKDAVSAYNLIDGFKNTAENVSHVSVIGAENEVKDTTDALVFGNKRKLSGASGSIVLGSSDLKEEIKVADATVLGHNANVTMAGGVALGSESVANRGQAEADNVYLKEDAGVKATVKGDLAAISVGHDNATRQITNVAAGQADTDAVNVAQLKAAAKEITDNINDTTLQGDNKALALDGTKLKLSVADTAGNKVTGEVDLKALQGAVDTDTRNTIVESDTVAVDDTNKNSDGSIVYKLNVKTDGKVEKDNQGVVNGGTVYKETRIEKDGTYIKEVNTAGENLTILDKQVGINTTNIQKNTENITRIENNLYDMGNRVGELDTRMNKVGAGAAALAALHPLDFDPEDKWDISAGISNYKNATAAAVGLFYRPNERTMLSLGWTMGDSRNMVNGGFSIKLGSGENTYAGFSRVQMATRLSQQEKEMQGMKAENEKLAADVSALQKDNKELREELQEIKKLLKK